MPTRWWYQDWRSDRQTVFPWFLLFTGATDFRILDTALGRGRFPPLRNKQLDYQVVGFVNQTGSEHWLPTVLHPDTTRVNDYTLQMTCVCTEGPFTESLQT